MRKTLVSKSEIETDFKSVSDLRGLPFSDRLKHKHWCGVMDKSSISEQYKIVKKRTVIFFLLFLHMSSYTSRFTELDIYSSEFVLREVVTTNSSTQSSSIYCNPYFANSDPILQGKSSSSLAKHYLTIPENSRPIDFSADQRSTLPLPPLCSSSQPNSTEKHFQSLAKRFKRFLHSISTPRLKSSFSSSSSYSFSN